MFFENFDHNKKFNQKTNIINDFHEKLNIIKNLLLKFFRVKKIFQDNKHTAETFLMKY